MTIEEAIEQLEDLIRDSKSFLVGGDDEIYHKDIEALETAIWFLKIFKEDFNNEGKGYYIDNEGYERCNNCNEHETGLRYFKFCTHCGTKV